MNNTLYKIVNIDHSAGEFVGANQPLRYSLVCDELDLGQVTVSYFNVVTGEIIQLDKIDASQNEIKSKRPVPDGVYDVRIQKTEPVTLVSGLCRIAVAREERKDTFLAEHDVQPSEFGLLQSISPVGKCSLLDEQETVTFTWRHDGAPPLCYQINLIHQERNKCIKVWRGIAPEKRTLTVENIFFGRGNSRFRWRVWAIYLQRNIGSEDSVFEIVRVSNDKRGERCNNEDASEQKELKSACWSTQGEKTEPPSAEVNTEVVKLIDVGVSFRKSGGNALKKMNFNVKSLFRRSKQEEKFWALEKVSFLLKHGDVLGIIGNNGAGKSTLLKVLTGVLLPDTGTVAMHGRISSLLSLGAGFMPYLSGRENIYLNGMYMGMSKEKISSIYDEIVEFSELEAFIDTPIRYYSSGMKARLGFSVAVHVEPEILVVDEVLATGDKNFRIKAEQKMRAFMEQAKVLIIASHSMKLISDLTNKCLLLEKGTVKQFGPTAEVVTMYNKS